MGASVLKVPKLTLLITEEGMNDRADVSWQKERLENKGP